MRENVQKEGGGIGSGPRTNRNRTYGFHKSLILLPFFGLPLSLSYPYPWMSSGGCSGCGVGQSLH
jgi:hypothetical protein